jgi:hypothetical protein
VRRLEELRLRKGLRAQLHIVARVLAPPPGEMRAHYPAARRGRPQLAAAYALRTIRGAGALPAAFRQWRTDRRTPDPGAVFCTR